MKIKRFNPRVFITQRALAHKNIVAPFWMRMDGLLNQVAESRVLDERWIIPEEFNRCYDGFSYTITNYKHLFKLKNVSGESQFYQEDLSKQFAKFKGHPLDKDIVEVNYGNLTKYKDTKWNQHNVDEIKFDKFILLIGQDWGRVPGTDISGLQFYTDIAKLAVDKGINVVMKIHPFTGGTNTYLRSFKRQTAHLYPNFQVVDIPLSHIINNKDRIDYAITINSGLIANLIAAGIPSYSKAHTDYSPICPVIEKNEDIMGLSPDKLDKARIGAYFSFYEGFCVDISDMDSAKDRINKIIDEKPVS